MLKITNCVFFAFMFYNESRVATIASSSETVGRHLYEMMVMDSERNSSTIKYQPTQRRFVST